MMKRFLVTCLLLVCCGSLWAGPLPTQLPGLRACTRVQLRGKGDTTTLHNNTAVDYALNRGLAATCEDFLCLEKVDTVVVASSDTASGRLSADLIEVKQVFQIAGDTLWLPILYRAPDSLPSSDGTVAAATQKGRGLGSFSYFHTWAGRLMTTPRSKSATDDTFIVYYYAYDSALADTTDTIHIADKYIEKVIWYACMVLSLTDGDLARAEAYRAQYERGIPPKPFKGNTEDK